MRYKYSYILLILFAPFWSFGQQVIQSEELNIKSHLAFHIIGKIDENILLYQDKGYEKAVVAFDENMVKLSTRTPYIEQRRIDVLELSSRPDTAFHMIYSYKDKETEYICLNSYNKSVELIDTARVIAQTAIYRYHIPYEVKFSDDGSKVAIYKAYDNEEIRVIIYDIHTQETLTDKIYTITNGFLLGDLNQTILSNSGSFWLVLQHFNVRSQKSKHFMQMLRVRPGNQDELDKVLIPLHDIVTSDVHVSINDQLDRVVVTGLFSEKDRYRSEGFFVLNQPLQNVGDSEIQFFGFTDQTINDLYGKDADDKKTIDNFVIADVVWRADGGLLLIMEMNLDFFRTPNYSGAYGTADPFQSRAWTNHLNEDMLVYSISPQTMPEWTKVIYKRQRSQDDQGIYSSFFTFKTPSRLRLIFNDEIKTSNTVSEYIFDSTGKVKRSSLQISSTEVLVPSQRAGFFSLVKIDYGV